MLVLLSKIMLGVSLIGLVSLFLSKIPVLVKLPESSAPVLSNVVREKTSQIAPDFSGFNFEKFLHKTLSKSKVLILKAEHKVDGQLKKIRKKNKTENKKDFSDDKYWDELKKEVDKDKSE